MNEYFYLDAQKKQQGPVAAERLSSLGVTAETLVWTSGMADWQPAGSVEALRPFLQTAQGSVPPPPPQGWAQGRADYSYTQSRPRPACPDSHMVAAVLVTIFCCLPLGIVAIVKANQVTSFYYRGDYDAALLASADADTWVKIALILGIISFCGSAGLAFL